MHIELVSFRKSVPAALFGLLIGFAPIESAGGERLDEARLAFERGVEAFSSERYNDALSAFEQAYRESGRLAILYNIAVTQRRLFHYVASVSGFRRYLEEAGDDVPRRRRLEVELAVEEMSALIGRLEIVDAEDGVDVVVDGKRIGVTPLEPVPIDPGEHIVELSLAGHESLRSRLTVPSNGVIAVHGRLVPVPEEEPPPPAEPPPAAPAEIEPADPLPVPIEKPREPTNWAALSALAVGTGALAAGGFFTYKYFDNYAAGKEAAREINEEQPAPGRRDVLLQRYQRIEDEKWPGDRVGMAVGYSLGATFVIIGSWLLAKRDEEVPFVSVFSMPGGAGAQVAF